MSAPPRAALFLLGMATTRKRDEAVPSTKPGHRLAAGRARKGPESDGTVRRKRSEMPTLPPPPATPRSSGMPPATPRASGMRPKRRSLPAPSATVDEVVADLTHDPRREKD
jgi:hypothetical protein